MAQAGTPTTVLDALRDVALTIEGAAVGDTPRLDAELLVGHVAGLDRVGLRTQSERELDPAAWKQLDALVGRRCAGEPIAYLLGASWFYGREFFVDERVLVPRPETELLVELALTHFTEHASSATFVDACTGSGCVAVSIAAELGDRAIVHATDISADALAVARVNADRYGAEVVLHEGDLLAPVAHLSRVAAVVANPPYVEGADAAGLEPGVRDHEPGVALFLPEGGLEPFYRRLALESAAILEPHGLLAVEHGMGQRDLVMAALRDAGLEQVAAVDDLAGIDRVVIGRRVG